MDTEIEAKFLNQDHDTLRDKLKTQGATLVQPERLMVRANYDFPDLRLNNTQKGWVRIRDEGDKITLSYKQSDDATLRGMQEVNLKVNSFSDAEKFLNAIGISKQKAYQESKRESWILHDVAVELDMWPWIKPYVELEAPTEAKLREVAEILDLDIQTAVFGSVVPAYQAEYDISADEMTNWPEYKFNLPVPDWLNARKKP